MIAELFAQIETVLPTLDGWCTLDKANDLAAAVLALRPKITVEIGVWGGKSLIPMALAAKACGAGMVIGIDPWSADASIANMTPANVEWWSKVDHKAVYQKFLDHLAALKLNTQVKIHVQKSDDVEPPTRIDFLHVDGNHSDQAVKDVERFAPKVRFGGLCFCDDIHWEGGGVERAVEKLKKLGFQPLYTRDTGAMFQRVK